MLIEVQGLKFSAVDLDLVVVELVWSRDRVE